MKKTVQASLKILLNLNISLWCAMIIADMLIPFIVAFCTSSKLIVLLVRIIGFILVTTIVLFYRTYTQYKDDYKKEEWHFFKFLVPILMSLAIQFFVSTIFGYVMYLTGAGYYIGRILYSGAEPIASRFDVPKLFYIIGTLITYPFYIAAIYAGTKLGSKKTGKFHFI